MKFKQTKLLLTIFILVTSRISYSQEYWGCWDIPDSSGYMRRVKSFTLIPPRSPVMCQNTRTAEEIEKMGGWSKFMPAESPHLVWKHWWHPFGKMWVSHYMSGRQYRKEIRKQARFYRNDRRLYRRDRKLFTGSQASKDHTK